MDELKNEFSIKLCCHLLDLPRSTYYYSNRHHVSLTDKYGYLEKDIKQIISDNSAYGYRRIKDNLKNEYGKNINHKLLRKLLREWGLSLSRQIKKRKPSGIESILNELGPRVNILKTLKEEEIEVFSVFQTDFTSIKTEIGTLYLMPLLCYKSKIVVAHALSDSADAETALRAYDDLKTFLKKQRLSTEGIIIHQDQGSAYISYVYVSALVSDDVIPSYSRKGTPGDNPGVESFFGRLKVEQETVFSSARNKQELIELVKESIRYYNYERIHSKTNGRSPMNNLPTIFV